MPVDTYTLVRTRADVKLISDVFLNCSLLPFKDTASHKNLELADWLVKLATWFQGLPVSISPDMR